jgi:zinc transporter ZupT
VVRSQNVAVCPDCDVFAVKASDYYAAWQQAAEQPVERSFSEELIRAFSYPLRHPVAASITWIAVLLGMTAGTSTYDPDSPAFQYLLIGSLQNFGILGYLIGFCIAECLSYNLMLHRSDGRETRDYSKMTDSNQFFQGLTLWLVSAAIGVLPLIIHTSIPLFQSIAAVIVEADVRKLPPPSIWHHLGTGFLLLWAATIYPLLKVIGAAKRDPLAMINPFVLVGAWASLKSWILPPFGLMVLEFAALAVIGLIIHSLPGGIILMSALLAYASLVASCAFGVAVHKGWETLDLYYQEPEPNFFQDKAKSEQKASSE